MEEAKREIMRKRDSVRVKMCERKRGGDTKERKNPRVKGGGGGEVGGTVKEKGTICGLIKQICKQTKKPP